MERKDIDRRLDGLDANRVDQNLLRLCLELLEKRNAMELERAQALDTKAAAILAGLLALVGFLVGDTRTWWLLLLSSLVFLPIIVLTLSLKAQDFSFAPPLESVLESVTKDHLAAAYIRAMTTFAKAVYDNRELVDKKGDKVNLALLVGSIVLPIVVGAAIIGLAVSHDSRHSARNLIQEAVRWPPEVLGAHSFVVQSLIHSRGCGSC